MTKSAHRIIHKLCQDRQNCRVSASDSLFDNHSCHGVPKYLEVSFKCINTNPNVRNQKRPLNPRFNSSLNVNSQINQLKNNRLNSIAVNNNNLNSNLNDNQIRNVDTAIYDSKVSSPSNELNNQNELFNNKKSTQISNNIHLDNNQNPFLNAGKRVPSSPPRFDINDQSSFGQINLTNTINNRFETKELSPKLALDNQLNHRNQPSNLTNYCSATTKRGVYFELTQAGKLISAACPPGSTNQVSWYCAPAIEDGQKAAWYPKDKPDFSKCSSLWLNSMEERLKDKNPMISKLVQELSSVTNIYQDINPQIYNQNSFLGLEAPKQLNSILGNERNQQILYARDLFRISEITASLVNKLESLIESNNNELNNKMQQQFNENQRRNQASLIHEMLIKLEDTISNLLVEQNKESWLELQPTERTLAISSLMSSLKKNALLFASVRPIVSSDFDRISRNLCK